MEIHGRSRLSDSQCSAIAQPDCGERLGGDLTLDANAPALLEVMREFLKLEVEHVVSDDWVVRYHNRLLQLERQTQHWAPDHAWRQGHQQMRTPAFSAAW